jgi:hypothetical protein
MAAQGDRDHGSAANCSADSAPGRRGQFGADGTNKSERNMDSSLTLSNLKPCCNSTDYIYVDTYPTPQGNPATNRRES